MPPFTFTVRAATAGDIVKLNANASVEDGASAIEVNGALLAVCNEYGTATLDGAYRLDSETLELANSAAMYVIAQARADDYEGPIPLPARVREITRALRELGQGWRTMWIDFDGRQLRSQLERIADMFTVPDPKATADDFEEFRQAREHEAGV